MDAPFTVEKEFYYQGKPIKIISGSIHYFRSLPADWEDRLYNLKAMGCNTVETYVPWNFHEPYEGIFRFDGRRDIVRFIQLAHQLNLFVIVRPSPYICAEWEFGGLPAWLLRDPRIRIRSNDPRFLKCLENYYSKLFEILAPLQVTKQGPIIMMQVENEYGTYGSNRNYLVNIKIMMEKFGIEVPLFTSDGGIISALCAGALGDFRVLPTVNFGSNVTGNFQSLKEYMSMVGYEGPLMCTEFWNGWFSHWGEEEKNWGTEEVAKIAQEILQNGSINFYMFHGGTNFGFYNGCTDQGEKNCPQTTSYDYGAPLDEAGRPTEKFYAFQKAIQQSYPEAIALKPRIPKLKKYSEAKLIKKSGLFRNLYKLSDKLVYSEETKTFEDLGQNYGYVLYETSFSNKMSPEWIQTIEAGDRIQYYLNGVFIGVQQGNEIGQVIAVESKDLQEKNTLQLLVENQGRNNYGPKLIAATQRKGIRGGVKSNIHYFSDWKQYSLSFEKISDENFSQEWESSQPAFFSYELVLEEQPDQATYVDCRLFGKGCIFVNGFHLGRYWKIGPTQGLYLPSSLLKAGKNKIIIFDTEGISPPEFLAFSQEQIYSRDNTRY